MELVARLAGRGQMGSGLAHTVNAVRGMQIAAVADIDPQRGIDVFTEMGYASGVFAVVYSDEPRIRKEMKFITRADGPYYLHFRPYHLCDLETPQSIAEAVLLGERTVTAVGANSEVVCVANRDLAPGQKVEGIGGCDWHGTVMTRDDAVASNAVPIGIGAGGTVTRSVTRGALITTGDLIPDPDAFVYRLREPQENLLAKGAL